MDGFELYNKLLSDSVARMNYVLDNVSEACLHWQPDGQGNSIAVTAWHVARLQDVFLKRNVENKPAEAELWQVNGWVEKTGYDPRGIGAYGWGSLQNYTPEEVAALPRFSAEQLKQYLAETSEAVKAYVAQLPPDGFAQMAAGFEGKHPVSVWCESMLQDTTRHVGEMFALQAMWERKFGES